MEGIGFKVVAFGVLKQVSHIICKFVGHGKKLFLLPIYVAQVRIGVANTRRVTRIKRLNV